MTNILPIVQVVLSILLVAGVLMQRSEAGLGAVFGSDSGSTRYQRRGAEKFLFYATIVVAILFAISAFLSLVFVQG